MLSLSVARATLVELDNDFWRVQRPLFTESTVELDRVPRAWLIALLREVPKSWRVPTLMVVTGPYWVFVRFRFSSPLVFVWGGTLDSRRPGLLMESELIWVCGIPVKNTLYCCNPVTL